MTSWSARIVLALVLIFVALAPAGAAPSSSAQGTWITLVHDTHLHGAFENANRVSLAHYAALVSDLRAQNPNTLFLGNGDDIGPSLFSSVFRGLHMIDALNAAGLDVNTFGNHEFDYGSENLRDRIRQSRFPWVTANVRDGGGREAFATDLGVRRFLLRNVGGVRVGFTGFAPGDTLQLVAALGPDVVVLDPITAAAEVVPQMRAAGAQLVVVLSHLTWRDGEALAAAVDGIDVIVGDHDQTALAQPIEINGAILSRRGSELTAAGQLDLEVTGGRITNWTYTEHRLSGNAATDSRVAEVIADYTGQLDVALGEEVGVTATPLDATRASARSRETGLGNMIADALREWAEADVGVQNGGGIRSERVYGPGPLTRRDIAAILPFTNYGAIVRLSGQGVWEMLELSLSTVDEDHGRFLHVSGLTFSYDPAAPAGRRLQSVSWGGAPLDLEASYTVAVNDFMQGGGDGYTMVRDGESLLAAQGGPLIGNVVADYIAMQGVVAPEVEERIVRLR